MRDRVYRWLEYVALTLSKLAYYPFAAAATIHAWVAFRRHVAWTELTAARLANIANHQEVDIEALREFAQVTKFRYDTIMLNTYPNQFVPWLSKDKQQWVANDYHTFNECLGIKQEKTKLTTVK